MQDGKNHPRLPQTREPNPQERRSVKCHFLRCLYSLPVSLRVDVPPNFIRLVSFLLELTCTVLARALR